VKGKLREWVTKFPDLRIGTFDLTNDENKAIGEALLDIYQIPEAQRERSLSSTLVETTYWETIFVKRISTS